MSGTSLDGLDLAFCSFDKSDETYSYKILDAKTVNYTSIWKERLIAVKDASAEDYFRLHVLYGKFLAEEVNVFSKASGIKADIIASHGHTIFHQPNSGFSTQIGCGATIAAETQITTVCDFRSLDVALGGQGAPLVPIGDKLLFGEYAACLNIGGIANISFDEKGKRIAYDVCEANMLLNLLAERSGKAFDKGGEMARAGKINTELLQKLNSLSYYSEKGAKSIGREWFEQHIEILLDKNINVNDLLATGTEHIAEIIAQELNKHYLKNILITGGGAFNTFLIEKIISKTSCEIILPEEEVINYKEALIFAFLGYLRVLNKTNTHKSVTGATKDSIAGAVYLP
ncbi:anhydro-N-acetylmuramic acid kinase [Aurantibacillus circumpalustris]|uniref:anhydro-N-acetylmuramic acid kinase n=1 Tax=Aurantibacillus circumpalustris TaxID=3036359 RepID=UPI0037C15157